MKRTIVVGFTLALAVAAGWLAGRMSGPDHAGEPQAANALRARDATPAGRADTAPTSADTATGHESPPSPPARVPVAASDAPLPAPDEPLAPHLAELRRRASAGDARAACRLAMQLDACARLPMLERFSDSAAAAAAVDPAHAPNGTEPQPWEASLRRLRHTCPDVVPLDDSEAFRWQMQAAMAGQPEMLYRAAAQPSLDRGAILEHVAEWRQWREHALDFLTRAIAGGDARAVMSMPEAFGAESDRPRIAPVDPVRQYLYARLRSRVAEASGDAEALSMAVVLEQGSQLPDNDRAAAEHEADALFAAHFAGQRREDLSVGYWKFDDFAACER